MAVLMVAEDGGWADGTWACLPLAFSLPDRRHEGQDNVPGEGQCSFYILSSYGADEGEGVSMGCAVEYCYGRENTASLAPVPVLERNKWHLHPLSPLQPLKGSEGSCEGSLRHLVTRH